MAQSVEELSFEYRDESGRLVRRQVDKFVLSKGAWATIMYLYQDLDRASGRYKTPKVAIVRYRKSNGVYRKQTSFNISSERQGRMIMEVLERWYSQTEIPAESVQGEPAQALETTEQQPPQPGGVETQPHGETRPRSMEEQPAGLGLGAESRPGGVASVRDPAGPETDPAPGRSPAPEPAGSSGDGLLRSGQSAERTTGAESVPGQPGELSSGATEPTPPPMGGPETGSIE